MEISTEESTPLLDKYQDDCIRKDRVSCGWRVFKPRCLERAARPRVLLTVICCYNFVNGFTISGITPANTSTIERRYGLPSSQVAWLASSHELAAGVLALLCGWLGSGKSHKGRLLAASAGVMGLGSIIMTVPHFLSGPFTQEDANIQICISRNVTECLTKADDVVRDGSWPLSVFITAQILHAVGSATLHTLAIPYLADNIMGDSISVYIGLMYTCQTVGPAVGFLVGGELLNLDVDIDKSTHKDISGEEDESLWIGAWWISYLTASAASFLVALTLSMFPSSLNGRRQLSTPQVSAAPSANLFKALKQIFAMPVFSFIMLISTLENGAIFGFNAFFPKILQFQFAQSPSSAGLYAGLITLTGGSLGQLLGGVLPHILKLDVRGLLRQVCVCLLLAAVASLAFFMACPPHPLAGINVPYNNRNEVELTSPCNGQCGCEADRFQPVCGVDGLVYFSPCHAGCADFQPKSNVYNNCSCINDLLISSGRVAATGQYAVEGYCVQQCSIFYAFIPLFAVLSMLMLMANTGAVSAVTRILPPDYTTIGFGVYWTVVRFLGNFPGPMIFGLIIDTSCKVWQHDCNNNRLACWVYDSTNLATKMAASAAVEKVFALTMCALAILCYPLSKPAVTEVALKAEEDDGSMEQNAFSDEHFK